MTQTVLVSPGLSIVTQYLNKINLALKLPINKYRRLSKKHTKIRVDWQDHRGIVDGNITHIL